MPLIQTADLQPNSRLTPQENQQVYCALDSMVMLEVHEELTRLHSPFPAIYSFERALQGPYLEIMQRGFAVDEISRRRAVEDLRERELHLAAILNEMAVAFWGKGLNPRSSPQLKDFFYKAMRLPEQWISFKGTRRVSCNREALEKLDLHYLYSRPIISAILRLREIAKQREVFEMEVSTDRRIRTSYNIAGTECISGDSLIWTKSGLRRIDEIYESPYAVAVWNGKEWAEPTRRVKYSDKEGYEITTEGGYKIKCSANHPLLTQAGFREARELSVGDRIQLNMGLPTLFGQHALPRGGLIEQMSEDFCEFIGIFLADGSLNATSEHYRCRLSNSDQEVKDRFIELVRNVFMLEATIYGDETTFSSKSVCSWLKNIGMLADSGLGTATIKTVPAQILRGKPNLIRALLRGLTLDSHITDKGLMYGTQSPKMQEQIQQMLLILGIVSMKMQTGDSIKLNVPRRYCGRFLSVIGFVQTTKLNALSRLLNERSQWHEPVAFGVKTFVEIKEIIPWRGDVYDLTMPETSPPQYVAQGMTVHNTGRSSSSENAYGQGGNMQNVSSLLRYVFVADPGWKLCQIDGEQAEARDVGWLCGTILGDWSYLDAIEKYDLHTFVTKQVWPKELPWTGNWTKDKKIASETIFYREFDYRYMAKRGAHLSNYMGSAWTAARSLKMPLELLEEFQAKYILGREETKKKDGTILPAITPAFPCIPKLWQWVAEQIDTRHHITTPFGRKRHFFGRGDEATLREAIAFIPQSTTADRMSLGMWRVWRHMPRVRLLGQGYDSIIFQFREEEDERAIVQQALDLCNVTLTCPTRTYTCPGEAKVGWNWGSQATQEDIDKSIAKGKKPPRLNLDGLVKWSPSRPDTRKRHIGLQRIA